MKPLFSVSFPERLGDINCAIYFRNLPNRLKVQVTFHRSLVTKPLLLLNIGLVMPKTMFRPTVSQFEVFGLL